MIDKIGISMKIFVTITYILELLEPLVTRKN